MTTIATDGKSMAGDTKCGNPTYHCDVVKVRRASDGAILGCCGDAYDIAKFLEWHEDCDGLSTPELNVPKDFEGLILMPDGTVICCDEKGRTFEHPVPAAIGSGCSIAYGAMDAGATPEEAIAIAIRRDNGTGGAVTTLCPSIMERTAA